MVAEVVMVVAVLAVVVLLLTRRVSGNRSGAVPDRRPAPREDALMEQLLRVTRGNRGAIERSVLAKRKKFPEATRAELLKMVYDDHQRDRRA